MPWPEPMRIVDLMAANHAYIGPRLPVRRPETLLHHTFPMLWVLALGQVDDVIHVGAVVQYLPDGTHGVCCGHSVCRRVCEAGRGGTYSCVVLGLR